MAPVVVRPGNPYDTDAILEAMANSRRPGGVPAALQTDQIAAAIASRVLTFDGEPWATMAIGGSCGPSTCTLEVGGSPPGAAGEDLYVWSVTPASGEVELVEASLSGLDPELLGRLDGLARRAAGSELDGLVLAGARWQLPPDASLFVLSYRSGGEEGAPAREVVLDVTTGTIRSD
jgi:hypothetical protein